MKYTVLHIPMFFFLPYCFVWLLGCESIILHDGDVGRPAEFSVNDLHFQRSSSMSPIKYPDGEVTILVAEVRKVSELRMGFEVDLLCTIEVGSLYVAPVKHLFI